MRWVYTTELCIPLRLKTVEKGHKVDVEELEALREKAVEVVRDALKEKCFELDGVMSEPFQLIPDWWGD